MKKHSFNSSNKDRVINSVYYRERVVVASPALGCIFISFGCARFALATNSRELLWF